MTTTQLYPPSPERVRAAWLEEMQIIYEKLGIDWSDTDKLLQFVQQSPVTEISFDWLLERYADYRMRGRDTVEEFINIVTPIQTLCIMGMLPGSNGEDKDTLFYWSMIRLVRPAITAEELRRMVI